MTGRIIDLRSDTITVPTAEMRRAMAEAEVGDDVFGEDPTVNELERRTAEVVGTEAALFVCSGTLANQLAIRTHTEAGDEVLLDADAHISQYEAGAPASLSGVTCRFLDGTRGIFTAADVRAALRPADVHRPPTRLICLENTHNLGGGSVWPIELIAEIAALAQDAGLKMHLDGARLWNASVASGIPERDYAEHFDSIGVCFSKGLGAPVGSALCGRAEFIDRARRFRKMFGGGMRQAGIIAAGALHALNHHRARLSDDHANARKLAEGISDIPRIDVDPDEVETNIVYLRIVGGGARELGGELASAGVKTLALRRDTIRAVTNLTVSSDGIDEAVGIFKEVLGREEG